MSKSKVRLGSILTEHIQKAKSVMPQFVSSPQSEGVQDGHEQSRLLRLELDIQSPNSAAGSHLGDEFGVECEKSVQNNKDLIQYLLESGQVVPDIGMTKSQKIEHKALFTNIDSLANNGNVGSIIGVTAFGFIGFVGLGFNIFGAGGGGAVGFFLGRYAGQKISKKLYKKHGILKEFDIFLIRNKCVHKWIEIQQVKYRYNVNVWRFALERLMIEMKPLLHFKCFEKWMQRESMAFLKDIRVVLCEESSLIAMYLGYKLAKEYIFILESGKIYSKFGRGDFEFVLSCTMQNYLRPFQTLFQDEVPKPNNAKILKLCAKISKLYTNPTVTTLMQKYPDPQLTLQYIKLFANKMKQLAKYDDLEQFMQTQNYKDIEALGLPLEQNQEIENIREMFEKQDPNRTIKRAQSYQELPNQIPLEVQDEVENRNPLKHSLTKGNQGKFNRRSNSMQSHSHEYNHQQSFVQNMHMSQSRQTMIQIMAQRGDDDDVDRGSIDQSSPTKQNILIDSPQIQIQISQTPPIKPPTQLSNELENKFKLMVELINEPIETWDIVLRKENILIYKTFKPGNEAVFVKGYGEIPEVDKDTVFDALHQVNLRTKWDKLLENFHVVEKESDEVDVVYYFVASPFGAANRDFLQKRIARKQYPKPDQDCLLYFSVDHKKAPNPKGYVRCQTFLSGYIMENTSQGARLYFVSNNNVGGNIPKSIINFVATRAPVSWFNSLRKGCKDLFGKENQRNQRMQQGKTFT